MLKFLVDECIGIILAHWLINKGYDAIAVIERVQGSPDHFILHKALMENRILITLDGDFGEIIFRQKAQHAGVIFLRLSDESPANQIVVMEKILKTYKTDLTHNFIVATERSVRVIRGFIEAQT